MNLNTLDWSIVIGMFLLVVWSAMKTRKYSTGVSDFLSANRCAGRYLLTVSSGMASLGLISVIALMQVSYHSGFTGKWWQMLRFPILLVIALSGFVAYRYRETRALTLGQFLEARYSKGVRIFAGIIAWISGIINFGIFPAVESKFFVYFCGLPETVPALGIPTYILIIFFLLGLSLFFAFMGGQLTVLVTDFVQGIFVSIVLLVILFAGACILDWSSIVETLGKAPAEASLLNPFHTNELNDFNYFFFIISAAMSIYATRAWQGKQGFNSSAKSAHEAKMAGILGEWKGYVVDALVILMPIGAYVIMNSPQFMSVASDIRRSLAAIGNEQIRDQMITPMVLARMLPHCLTGFFCAAMFAASVSTLSSYMHSWGSIFVQDIILPFRKTPFRPQHHIFLLRVSIIFVAIFAFMFSILFTQNEYIMMFFAITGAIYVSGAGSLIIGGLYWKRGTTTAAWLAMIIGSTFSIGGLVMRQTWASHIYPWLDANVSWLLVFLRGLFDGINSAIPGIHWKISPSEFPMNSQWYYFLTVIIACSLYIICSLAAWLLWGKSPFDMDRLLHRGKYAIPDEHGHGMRTPPTGLRALLPTHEFSRWDKGIYYGKFIWTLIWILVFIFGTIYNLCFDCPDSAWAGFWKIYIILISIVGTITTIWFLIGSMFDLKDMFHRLKNKKTNIYDDGMVIRHHNLADELSADTNVAKEESRE